MMASWYLRKNARAVKKLGVAWRSLLRIVLIMAILDNEIIILYAELEDGKAFEEILKRTSVAT